MKPVNEIINNYPQTSVDKPLDNNAILKSKNNDNVVLHSKTNNVQCNNVRNKQDHIADKLVLELGNEDYRVFYCKVAYRLSEAQIWSALDQAKKGNNPAKYFTWLVKRMM